MRSRCSQCAKQSATGVPHSKTLRVPGCAFLFAAASWSAALLCRFHILSTRLLTWLGILALTSTAFAADKKIVLIAGRPSHGPGDHEFRAGSLLLQKCLKQPEPNAELFYFTEDALHHLDEANEKQTANFPIFFALHLAVFFGFRISDEFSETHSYLDLEEGSFVKDQPRHQHFLVDREAAAVSHILKVMHPSELEEMVLNQDTRRRITHALETYYALHISDFGSLRTLPVLKEILS